MAERASNDRRVKRTKKNLKQSLIVLMQTKDFQHITITDIITHADYNRSTFYNHYQVKEEILNELINDVLEEFCRAYRACYENQKSLVSSDISATDIKIFNHVIKYADFYKLAFSTKALSNFPYMLKNKFIELALEDLSELSSNSKVNRELKLSFQASAVLGLIKEWIDKEYSYSPEYMAEQFTQLIKQAPISYIIN